ACPPKPALQPEQPFWPTGRHASAQQPSASSSLIPCGMRPLVTAEDGLLLTFSPKAPSTPHVESPWPSNGSKPPVNASGPLPVNPGNLAVSLLVELLFVVALAFASFCHRNGQASLDLSTRVAITLLPATIIPSLSLPLSPDCDSLPLGSSASTRLSLSIHAPPCQLAP
ncbi:hypothetical protein AMTR_s00026p00052480, partial [Amborella trichopoda]